jgi:hypothetical protein
MAQRRQRASTFTIRIAETSWNTCSALRPEGRWRLSASRKMLMGPRRHVHQSLVSRASRTIRDVVAVRKKWDGDTRMPALQGPCGTCRATSALGQRKARDDTHSSTRFCLAFSSPRSGRMRPIFRSRLAWRTPESASEHKIWRAGPSTTTVRLLCPPRGLREHSSNCCSVSRIQYASWCCRCSISASRKALFEGKSDG